MTAVDDSHVRTLENTEDAQPGRVGEWAAQLKDAGARADRQRE